MYFGNRPSDLEMCLDFDPHDKLTVEIMTEAIIPRLIDELNIWNRGVEKFTETGHLAFAELCKNKADTIKFHLEIAFQKLGEVKEPNDP